MLWRSRKNSSCRRGVEKDMAGITGADVGEAMHDPLRNLHTRPGPDDLGAVTDQVLQRPFQDDEQLVLGC